MSTNFAHRKRYWTNWQWTSGSPGLLYREQIDPFDITHQRFQVCYSRHGRRFTAKFLSQAVEQYQAYDLAKR